MRVTNVAIGIQAHPQFKLGSILGSGKADNRTLTLSDFVQEGATQIPVTWDFDLDRKPFPRHMWGNDDYGDCELAGRANYLQRLQRIQTKTTPAISDQDVVDLYKQMTGCVSPGDQNDTGLATVQNLSQWRQGWSLTKDWQIGGEQTRNYQISAYGLIDITKPQMLRTCAYLFHGILFGIALPLTAQAQTENGQPWDVVDPSLSGDSAPGSWGGHCTYSKKFDDKGMSNLTWATEILMTDAFISAYVQEAYCVVDSFDTWFNFPHILNVQAMIQKMKDNGIQVQQ